MKTTTLQSLLALAGALMLQPLSAQIVTYNFNNTDGTPSSSDPQVTATTIASNGLNSFGYNTRDYGPSGSLSVIGSAPLSGANSAANALSLGSYFSFDVTVDSGQEMDLTSISFIGARGGSSTPRGFGLATSVDGFSSVVASNDMTTQRNEGMLPYSWDLSAPAFQGLTGTVTFHVLVYAPGTANTVEMDDLTLNGSVSAIPEPTTYAAMFGALALLGVWIRRRR